jgi:nitrite reductase/ring-hydroxylating ferredoxin subunit
MTEFVKVAKTTAIEPGKSSCVEASGKKIAIFNLDGSFFAIDDVCSHRGGPLSQGQLQGENVTCPWHGAVFDVKTGAVVKGPATAPQAKYNLRVVGDDIEVEI